MGIPVDDIARVRAASDLVQIASEHIALRKVGRRYQGLCPFHAEKTPSFSINAEEGLFYCFGCQAKGDVITFLRDMEHLEFAEAVERLAAKAGIELQRDDSTPRREHLRRARLLEVLGRAVDWYHERLLHSPDAAPARAYLRSRGYEGDVVRQFRMGWAPDDWDALARALRLSDDLLRETGLGFMNRRGRQQDAFRARVMFPIFDVHGDPVAFGGRALPGASGPKYKNSSETELYSKSRVLYGLNWAKTSIVDAGEVIICEGYTDVIGFHTCGLSRAVATCGTALGEGHVRVLKNFARRLVLAYDADTAGQTAAARVYEWEQGFELDIAVAALAPGSDPAEVARRDPEGLASAVAGAQSFLAFRLDRVFTTSDLRTPEGRARAADAALSMIAEHPSELVRDQYVMQVADRCRIGADRLRERLARRSADSPAVPRAGTRPPLVNERGPQLAPPADPGPRRREREGPEREALKLLLHRRDEVADRLHEVLFDDELARAAYRALASSDNIHGALEGADPEVEALLRRMAVLDTDADATDVVHRLIRTAGRRALAEIDAGARQSDDPLEYMRVNAPVVEWLVLTMEKLDQPDVAIEAAGVLVPWLVDRLEGEA